MQHNVTTNRRVAPNPMPGMRPAYEKPVILSYQEQDLLEMLGPVQACNSTTGGCIDYIDDGLRPPFD